jgi:hypothetical protein
MKMAAQKVWELSGTCTTFTADRGRGRRIPFDYSSTRPTYRASLSHSLPSLYLSRSSFLTHRPSFLNHPGPIYLSALRSLALHQPNSLSKMRRISLPFSHTDFKLTEAHRDCLGRT